MQRHIEQDGASLAEMARTLEEGAPALEQAREAESEANARLNNAEQSMQDWQSRWDDFNQRSAEPTRISEVERARIDQFDRHLAQLDQRRTRLEEERSAHSSSALDAEIAEIAQLEATAAESFQLQQQRVQEYAEQLAARRDQNQQITSEFNAARGQKQDAHGRLVSLQALQQAALGRSAGAVSDWLSGQGLG